VAQPNGTTQTITGEVEAANERGIRVQDTWLNCSKFRPVTIPDVGALVAVTVDAQNWIHRCDVLDTDAADMAPTRARMAVAAPGVRERTITRLAVLKAAAAFAASRPDAKSPDVLTVADVWLRWVEGEA
jgi:hypothetical protein